MNVPAKNISQVGTILAVLLFMCGLFHSHILAFFDSFEKWPEPLIGVYIYLFMAVMSLLVLAVWFVPLAIVCWGIIFLFKLDRTLL